MIKMPYDQVIEKITHEAPISRQELQERIDAKLKQLSGLISKEGAAHIVANELGIKLLDASSATTGKLQIKNIVPGLRNVETVGKVLQTYGLKTFKSADRDGKLASFVLGDESGTIRVVMWGNQADAITNLTSNPIVKIVGAYVRENNNSFELHMNEKSRLIINPPGEQILVKEKVSERKSIGELSEEDQSVEVLGTIVQVFDPRFFEVDPKSGKRITAKDGVYYLGNEIIENPDYSYVMNVIIDDGTSNMRAVFFREAMERLIGKDKGVILEYKDNPSLFEDVKTDLLGLLVKMQGRVKKNLFFDRLELTVNNVSINPDPQDEIARLNAAIASAKSQ